MHAFLALCKVSIRCETQENIPATPILIQRKANTIFTLSNRKRLTKKNRTDVSRRRDVKPEKTASGSWIRLLPQALTSLKGKSGKKSRHISRQQSIFFQRKSAKTIYSPQLFTWTSEHPICTYVLHRLLRMGAYLETLTSVWSKMAHCDLQKMSHGVARYR